MKRQNEYLLQKAVCQYIRYQYPNVLFMTDTIAAIKLTAIQGQRNKDVQKEGFKCPDLIVLKPLGGYSGLMLELKLQSPYYAGQFKKLKKNKHVEEQSRYLSRLNGLGYYACFAWSLDMAIGIIDDYMNEKFLIFTQPHTHKFYMLYNR